MSKFCAILSKCCESIPSQKAHHEQAWFCILIIVAFFDKTTTLINWTFKLILAFVDWRYHPGMVNVTWCAISFTVIQLVMSSASSAFSPAYDTFLTLPLCLQQKISSKTIAKLYCCIYFNNLVRINYNNDKLVYCSKTMSHLLVINSYVVVYVVILLCKNVCVSCKNHAWCSLVKWTPTRCVDYPVLLLCIYYIWRQGWLH